MNMTVLDISNSFVPCHSSPGWLKLPRTMPFTFTNFPVRECSGAQAGAGGRQEQTRV